MSTAGAGPDSSDGREVRIQRWQLWLIVTSAAVSVIALAFVTGYEAAHWGTSPVPGERAPAETVFAEPRSLASLPERAGNATALATPAAGASTNAGAALAAPPSPALAPVNDTLRAQVAAYFAETDAILGSAKQSGDPNTVARKMLEQAVSGDSGGLDQMIAAQRTLAERLAGIHVPAPCVEHHRRSVALLAKGADLLQQAAAAIRTGEMGGLAALATGGQEIEGEARGLDALASGIRKQYGLP
jgi:hypothetical protein